MNEKSWKTSKINNFSQIKVNEKSRILSQGEQELAQRGHFKQKIFAKTHENIIELRQKFHSCYYFVLPFSRRECGELFEKYDCMYQQNLDFV